MFPLAGHITIYARRQRYWTLYLCWRAVLLCTSTTNHCNIPFHKVQIIVCLVHVHVYRRIHAAQFIYSKLWNVFVSICSRIMYVCRSPRPQWSGVFLLNACVALLLLNLSVVASYHGRPSEKCCHSFSAILHYVFLASVLSLTALAVTKFGRARGMKNKERTCGGKTFVIISGLAIIWSK